MILSLTATFQQALNGPSMRRSTWMYLPVGSKTTIEHFKEVLNISSAQVKQELQYFTTTNNFSFDMFLLFQLPQYSIYHVPV